jgi:peptidoglycan L-alanyl-D-glutamate endopeptidase CwlK
MAVDLTQLDQDFQVKIQELLTACSNAGYSMRPNEGIRSPFEQGRLWRQSRTGAIVHSKINQLDANGQTFLAECIRRPGPSNGDHVTNAIPGLSWHQWGNALDCVWIMPDGSENWSDTSLLNGKNGYHVYADIATDLGLNAGGHWESLTDWPHVQLPAASSPLNIHTMQEINDIMKQRFGP